MLGTLAYQLSAFKRLSARAARRGYYPDLEAKKLRRTFLPVDFKEDLFRRNRFYVACQTNDDLLYILKYDTEDSLMIGTD